jgi:hypothetical protein
VVASLFIDEVLPTYGGDRAAARKHLHQACVGEPVVDTAPTGPPVPQPFVMTAEQRAEMIAAQSADGGSGQVFHG